MSGPPFKVEFITPSWCYGGNDPNTFDFNAPNNQGSSAGYASSGNRRLYSRAACENLGNGDGIWHANGECSYVLGPDNRRYYATAICAGLNDTSPDNVVGDVAEFSTECPSSGFNTGWIYAPLIGVLGLGLGLLFHMKK
jgi:hypothetical protein